MLPPRQIKSSKNLAEEQARFMKTFLWFMLIIYCGFGAPLLLMSYSVSSESSFFMDTFFTEFGFIGKLLASLLPFAILYSPAIVVFIYCKVKGYRKEKLETEAAKKLWEINTDKSIKEGFRRLEERKLLEEEKKLLEEEKVQYSVNNWRTNETYPVGNNQTGIFAPYEVETTQAENRLLNIISRACSPYCIFADTYIPKENNGTTQIDIIAICPQGVIVIESKGFGGAIFGKVSEKNWIQKTPNKKDWQFYNPIKQNDLHVKSLKQILGLNNYQFYSLIVFDNDAHFEGIEYLPPNCYVLTARRFQEVLNEIFASGTVLSKRGALKAAYELRNKRIVPSQSIRDSHIKGVRESMGISRIYE